VRANVKLREAVPAGTVFLAEGTLEDRWNVLTSGLVEIHRIGAGSLDPSAVAAQITPAAEGLSEMPPSAPLPIPPREVT
jgi:NADH-quinone oxidoreductase subunit G